MADYTEHAQIIRGSRWPAAGDKLPVRLTKASGWPAGSDSWTWTLRFARAWAGGGVDLTLTADTATIDGDVMILTFAATPAQTASLPGSGQVKFNVDVKSDDGAGELDYYDCVQGTAEVRNPTGNVS